jgi:hypothetical protein
MTDRRNFIKQVFAAGVAYSMPYPLFARPESLQQTPFMVKKANDPIGEAQGIFPGRVSWIHAPGTANWDGNGYWFEDQYNNQGNTDWMIRQAILTLTGKKNEKAAWSALFSSYNSKKGKKQSYLRGEKIAIKVNGNNTASHHEEAKDLNASPHLTLSLLKSLINQFGVAQEDITVFEPSRYLTDFFYKKCSDEFPGVIFVDNEGGDGRVKATSVKNAIPYSADNGMLAQGLATSAVEADYLINMALLKGHVGQGVTLCAKNWYGATDIHSDWRKNHHNNFDPNRDGSPRYMTFVDFMGHKDLGGKTVLYLIDGLYGSENVGGPPSRKWNMSPFNGSWPDSLFASQDAVAIDAVGLDFLAAEFPKAADMNYADSYLVEAALANNPPSGAFYDPERSGSRLKSLGVMEHWNNSVDKQYSRNLKKNIGIELVRKMKK